MLTQVNENGVISFNEPWKYSYPDRFPSENFYTRRRLVVAPFWSDNDIRLSGAVRYATYSETNDKTTNEAGQMLLDEINEYIQDRQSSEEEMFVGNWLLIAHWDHVHPSPHGEGSQSEVSMEELERVLFLKFVCMNKK